MTDTQIQLQGTETERLLEALERGRPRLKWIMARFRLSKQDAEDLLQDLAVVAIQKYPKIYNLDGWLLGAALRMCLHRARTRRRHPEFEPWEGLELAISPEQERTELACDLKKALAILPPRHRRYFVLRAMGFSSAEIALRTGYSERLRIWPKRRVAAKLEELRNRSGYFVAGEGNPA